MKHFCALPVAIRVAWAVQHPFSVQNDLLAFPQYELVFSESYIPAEEAARRLTPTTPSSTGSDLATGSSSERLKFTDDDDDPQDGDVYERMIFDEQPYLCRIPYVPPDTAEPANDSSTTQAEQQQELIRASNHGWELLSGLQGTCLYYGRGWWMYSFCYGDILRQFHAQPPGGAIPVYPPTPDPNVYNFVLGKFAQNKPTSKDTPKGDAMQTGRAASATDLSAELQTRGETNFLVQKLGGGTTCDLTGVERRIEVQFHCNPGSPDRISMIKETAACVYLMVIHTPRLCNDVAFMPPQFDKPNTISCQEIVEREDETRWKAVKAAKAQNELFSRKGSTDEGQQGERSKRPVIGGIELGGQKLVGGSPDRQIKVSNIAKPKKLESQEEKFIVTLAESDGKRLTMLNEREIQKYDIKGSLEDIEEFIIKTENWAESFREGQPWRLDVVQTADGLQFRGILMDDEELGSTKTSNQAEQAPTGKGEGKQEQQQQEGSEEEYKQKKQP